MNMRTTRGLAFTALLVALATGPLLAQDPGPLPPFEPPVNRTNTLRIWGHPYLSAVVENWGRGFHAPHPEITLEAKLQGNGTAMPALYTGLADIALLGRDLNTTDKDGFAHVLDYPHVAIEVATGSLAAPGKSPALVVFVHRDNPLARLTLAQLDAIFGPELRRGASAVIRTWDQLGLTGAWRGQPIHLYADDSRTGTGQFFQRVVLRGSSQRNWESFTEFKGSTNIIGGTDENGRQIADALRTDRLGLAVSTLRYAHPQAKSLALAAADGEPFYAATRETVVARTYPLARPIVAVVNRAPGHPLDAKVRDFLRYVLSADGQQAVEREGGYLPLNPDLAAEQLKKLE
jgi:phosphate transport system substrate-binding protein